MTDKSANITIPVVLSWILNHLDDAVRQLRAAIPLIEAEFTAADSEYARSGEFFKGPAGNAARERSGTEKSDGLATVDVIELLPDMVSEINETFRSEISKIRSVLEDVSSSKWDLFSDSNGNVQSRKSNWETSKEHWWNPGRAANRLEHTHRVQSDQAAGRRCGQSGRLPAVGVRRTG
ncbi:hypothetical protein ABZ319_11915 [Nocardia sp. NPDC005978]|uniref:hypothetical protein n=1 Tax=Nocardia sp. NPDC005978 TaxID=3156725 RepID=UPI0033B56BD8